VSRHAFYVDKNISKTSEQLLCLIQKDRLNSDSFVIRVHDPVKGTWETVPLNVDPRFVGIEGWCQCIVVNWKLVLMKSVYDPLDMTLMKSVYIHDFQSTRWSRGADMPTTRALIHIIFGTK
jgi:hypothetical protein